MKNERSNVDFPLWRKKVDRSLFEHNATPIPVWAWKMWCLEEFEACSSKKDEKSKVIIRFDRKDYEGWVTLTKGKLEKRDRRLFFSEQLAHKLKYTFLMSYMRSLESSLVVKRVTDIEDEIPFWELLDIEYHKEKKCFNLVAHYTQKPIFPNLFAKLISSPSLKKIARNLYGARTSRIEKQDWMTRDQFKLQIGAKNVIYHLIDSKKKLYYIGETGDLISRFNQGHPSIKDWDYFRYNVLPDELAPYRVEVERMLIRDFASLFPNKRGIKHRDLTGYNFSNDKIDIN